ncbi:outer membrane lipoprotein-sorting protein [Treponema sp.]|uniref:outer membrane lipoprotein-sorting protein n=1 Tax=Treponema sp. TaxID=166 RepID=UPI0025E1FEBF|nr:outer membrane lipoprotein-sorting protein [Treponema sp.]MCR5217751.1 outer membrane lipoprotein-sorting protein [Treponema sp.]
MKKLFLLITACLMTASISALSANEELLKKAQDNTSFYDTDFYAQYSIVQDKPGEGRSVTEAQMFRRDKSRCWTILVTAPSSEKGKGYLQLDETIWFYDPADRRFTFSSARDKFQNTNANTSDFGPQNYYTDYKIISDSQVKLGKYNCILFELEAKKETADYPLVKLWVSQDDGLVRKKEDYSLSGKKIRTTVIPSYQKVTSAGYERRIPVSMIIQDNLKGKKIAGKMEYEKTLVSISNVSLKKVEDAVYTKPYLEMAGAR